MNHTESQLKNLEKRKRFGKEVPPAKSPGRPKTQHISEYFREWLEKGKHREQITRRLMRLKPDVILHYAHGKPLETQVQLVGDMAQSETEKAVARILANGGIQSPSPEIKTP